MKKKVYLMIVFLFSISLILCGILLMMKNNRHEEEQEVSKKTKELISCRVASEDSSITKIYNFEVDREKQEITVLNNDTKAIYSTKEEYDQVYSNIHNPEMHQHETYHPTYEYDEEQLAITFQFERKILYEEEIDKTKENWIENYLELIKNNMNCESEEEK